MKVTAGQRVRSHDFGRDRDGRPSCYVEGLVVHADDEVVCVFVDRDVWNGIDVTDVSSRVGQEVYPPQNDLPRLMGGVTDGLEVISDA